MSADSPSDLKLLVCIASYGRGNDVHLARLLEEYRSLPYSTTLVVLSNVAKDCGPDVEVRVGLPTKDPWSLPFGHRSLFDERQNDYDLFLYSEDDILITRENIEAFRRQTEILREDEIAGFLRFETDSQGERYYPDLHWNYHWAPSSVVVRGGHTFAFLTNEHSACYLLTRRQLQKAIASGNFLVPPHSGKYDLLVTAATDPYTQCGFRRLVCVSDVDSVLVHHLSNKYIGRVSLPSADFRTQIAALLDLARGGGRPAAFLNGDAASPLREKFAKDLYEPPRRDIIDLVPAGAKRVLSIGCGIGATEAALISEGKSLAAVPVDSVFGACATARHIEVLGTDLKAAVEACGGEKFDCVLVLGILHLLARPAEMLRSVSSLLRSGGRLIVTVPNLASLSTHWKSVRTGDFSLLHCSYEDSGVHRASHRRVKEWLRGAGLKDGVFADVLPDRLKGKWPGALRLAAPVLSSEIVAVGVRP